MYDAMGDLESQAEVVAASSSRNGTLNLAGATTDSSSSDPYSMEPPSAVIVPSGKSNSPASQIRHKELDPSTVDTGKDTQRLVLDEEDEDTDSEC